MEKKFIETVKERIILADGGIGTEIYNRGFYVNRCYDHLNITDSGTIRTIHKSFIDAGSQLIRTNTFGANRIRLANHGLAEHLEKINRRGVEIAKEVSKDLAYVAGTLGPVPDELDWSKDQSEIESAYCEQVNLLADAGVDLLMLESVRDLEEIKRLYSIIHEMNLDLPLIPSLAYSTIASNTVSPERYIQEMKSLGAVLAGINGGSASDLNDLAPILVKATGKEMSLSLFPDAGQSSVVDGRTLYLASPEFLAEYTRRFVQHGVNVVGGCSGITPPMIKEIATFIRSIQPQHEISFVSSEEDMDRLEGSMEPIPIEKRSPFGAIMGKKFTISVELDPPKGIDATKSVQGAKFLYENGIDVVNIADGPRASGRMSPLALSVLVKQEVPIDTIIHVCCRDRNLLALQMDLISSNATGLRNLMIITGDPPKMGIYPNATAVFDLDAIGLVTGASLMNRGLDFAKRPLKGQTSFVIGVGCNPGASDLDREVRRYEEKVKAGAEYVFSQPIYDPEILDRFIKRIEHVKPIPFFVGILPLASYKNAEFFTREVPGMQVPKEIMERMRLAPTKEAQREEGIKIAAEALKSAKKYPLINGAYIFPPFGRYESILDVLDKSCVR